MLKRGKTTGKAMVVSAQKDGAGHVFHLGKQVCLHEQKEGGSVGRR